MGPSQAVAVHQAGHEDTDTVFNQHRHGSDTRFGGRNPDRDVVAIQAARHMSAIGADIFRVEDLIGFQRNADDAFGPARGDVFRHEAVRQDRGFLQQQAFPNPAGVDTVARLETGPHRVLTRLAVVNVVRAGGQAVGDAGDAGLAQDHCRFLAAVTQRGRVLQPERLPQPFG